MAIASGVAKKLVYKKETVMGVAPGATGAQYLRRVTSDLNVTKEAYQSGELRTDYQVADYRHGIRSVSGNINGEISLGTYKDFFAAALRAAWASGVSVASLTITVSATNKTFTRSAGSWLTDGFKIGDVVRFSGFTSGFVGMNGVNYRIVTLTATVMTVAENTALVDATSQTAITCAVAGKKLIVPVSGHTKDSFSIEHFYSDIAQSELYRGCMVNSIGIALPATGMATIQMGFLGLDVTTGTAAYYTTPTAETTTAILAAVSGKLRVGASDLAVVTGVNLNIASNITTAQVVGSNYSPDLFPGRVLVSGDFNAYFQDATLRDAFLNESELNLAFRLDATSATTTDFLSIVLNRLKLGGATKDDGEKGLIESIPFTALLNVAGGTGTAYDKTTIAMQDTLA